MKKLVLLALSLSLLGTACAAETSESSAPEMDDTTAEAMPHIERGCKAFASMVVLAQGGETSLDGFMDIAEEEFGKALAIDSGFRGAHDALRYIRGTDTTMAVESLDIVRDFCVGMNQSGAFK